MREATVFGVGPKYVICDNDDKFRAQFKHVGELGELRSINAPICQNWGPATVGTWRQKPDISGGGILFDTGAHVLNTVSDLAGQNFVEAKQDVAWLSRH